jgi:hypothetical protein
MNKDKRIQDCIDNYEKYVARLATFPDKKLIVKLDLIELQSEIAYKKNIISSIELLEIWRRQVIEARILKAENKIPDAPNEIELALANMEFESEKAEQRQEIIKEYLELKNEIEPEEKIHKDNYTQLSLF